MFFLFVFWQHVCISNCIIINWYQSSRNCLKRICWKKERQLTPDPAIDVPEISDAVEYHNYNLLEQQQKYFGENHPDLASKIYHYAIPQGRTNYKATTADQDDDYDLTEQGQAAKGNPTNQANDYNTFRDFHQDNYDHLGDQKKPPRVTENEYNTTQSSQTQVHVTTVRPDNVYGMTRVDNDYERMPPVSC